jgi:hypothetical protein
MATSIMSDASMPKRYNLEISESRPGGGPEIAFVGPPAQRCSMGATQLRLLCSSGFDPSAFLLKFGWAWLHAGRLLIAYRDWVPGGRAEGRAARRAVRNNSGPDSARIKKTGFGHDQVTAVKRFALLSHSVPSQPVSQWRSRHARCALYWGRGLGAVTTGGPVGTDECGDCAPCRLQWTGTDGVDR